MTVANEWRKTTQDLAPLTHTPTPRGHYDLYPGFPVGAGKIDVGYDALATAIAGAQTVIIDGYVGVFWEDLRAQLDAALTAQGVTAHWVNVDDALRPEAEIDALIAPFLGGDDPIFGTRFQGTPADFFDTDKLAALQPDAGAAPNIVYGCGAALAGWDGLLVYVDLPKNELQFRSRAGTVRNLGARASIPPKPMYKRFYFVD